MLQSRPSPRRAVRALLLVLLLPLVASLTAVPASSRPLDGSDSRSASRAQPPVAGWSAGPARRARLEHVRTAHRGAALLLGKRAAGPVATNGPRLRRAGTVGTRYAARVWVRGSRTGERVVLTVRERAHGKVVGKARAARTLRTGVWTKVTTRLHRTVAGSRFRLRVALPQRNRSDRLLIDDARLVRKAGASRDCFNQRGVPSCGALVGAAYGANTDPARLESDTGHPLALRRTYFTASQVSSAVRIARTDLASGRLPWISFKLPHSWESMAAGAGDAWARSLARQLATLPGPVWVAFHHEPEGDGDIDAWRAMQERLAPLVRSTAPNVAYTVVLTGWNQLYGEKQYRLDSMWPRGVHVDVAGFDVYNQLGVVKNGVTNVKGTDLASSYFAPISRWAKARGIAWGLAETGYTDHASTRDPDWIRRTFRDLSGYGGVAFTYFNTTLNSIAPWDLSTSTKLTAFSRAQAESLRLPR